MNTIERPSRVQSPNMMASGLTNAQISRVAWLLQPVMTDVTNVPPFAHLPAASPFHRGMAP